MSKAVDAYLLNEMQKDEDRILMFGVVAMENEMTGIMIDSLSASKSINENMEELFPQENASLGDYELEKIKEQQDLLNAQMEAAGIVGEE